ncbi:hypothetical protein [Streptomyces sp. NPDC055287]
MSQLPVEAEVFARYLRELTALVDTGAGWCGVFWQRDPDGMRACLEGAELPPWDVLEALLQDLVAGRGTAAAERESERARTLHGAAAAARDRRPGGRETLTERLGAMRREQAYAAERERELTRRLRDAVSGSEWQGLDVELAWARDDHERATARCAELSTRLADLDALPPPPRARPPAPESWFRTQAPEAAGARAPGPQDAFGAGTGASETEGDTAVTTDIPVRPSSGRPATADLGQAQSPSRGGAADVPPGKGRAGRGRAGRGRGRKEPHRTPADRAAAPKRRPRGARYAGLDDDDSSGVFGSGMSDSGVFGAGVSGSGAPDGGVFGAPAARPEPPVRAATPRGARFAGVEEAEPVSTQDPAVLARERRAVTDTVALLVQLRAQGRTGEAHVLLCEAAGWPAARLPVLAGALHQAGLGADWATFLWEAASLPTDRVVAVAAALDGAGLAEDGRQLLRQGVARPAPEIASALLALDGSGHAREVRSLVDAFVRVRTPEDAAQVARTDPRRLSPLLLDAARKVSQSRYRDVVHALRVAGAAP